MNDFLSEFDDDGLGEEEPGFENRRSIICIYAGDPDFVSNQSFSEKYNFSVLAHENFGESVDLDEYSPSLVIVECRMVEGMEDMQVVKSIRNYSPTIPILAISENDHADYLLEIYNMGATDCLLAATPDSILLQKLNIYDEITKKNEYISIQNREMIDSIEKIKKANEETRKIQESYAASLEVEVELKTQTLQQVQSETREMLDNMKQAIFTFDDDLLINEQYSHYCKDIFGEEPPVGTNGLDWVLSFTDFDDKKKKYLIFTISSCFHGDADDWFFAKLNLPDKMDMQIAETTKELKLIFEPIFDSEGKTTRLMLVIQDETELNKLQKLAKEREEKIELISSILEVGKNDFNESMEEFASLLRASFSVLDILRMSIDTISNEEKTKAINELFRYAHTIKGNAKTLKFKSMESLVHKLEDELSDLKEDQEMFTREKVENLYQKFNEAELGIEENRELRKSIFGDNSESSVEINFEKLLLVSDSLNLFKNEVYLRNVLKDDKDRRNTFLRRLNSIFLGTPLKNIIERFDKSLQEIAPTIGKKLNPIVIRGNVAYVDKKISSILSKVLVHVLRNALDHGIEESETRLNKGKPEAGTIEVSVNMNEGVIDILVQDDGKGIDQNIVKSKAIEKHIITKEESTILDQDDIINLIFHPGFSTSDSVSTLSGRGVGMDMVLSEAKKYGGYARVYSDFGFGTNTQIVIHDPHVWTKSKQGGVYFLVSLLYSSWRKYLALLKQYRGIKMVGGGVKLKKNFDDVCVLLHNHNATSMFDMLFMNLTSYAKSYDQISIEINQVFDHVEICFYWLPRFESDWSRMLEIANILGSTRRIYSGYKAVGFKIRMTEARILPQELCKIAIFSVDKKEEGFQKSSYLKRKNVGDLETNSTIKLMKMSSSILSNVDSGIAVDFFENREIDDFLAIDDRIKIAILSHYSQIDEVLKERLKEDKDLYLFLLGEQFKLPAEFQDNPRVFCSLHSELSIDYMKTILEYFISRKLKRELNQLDNHSSNSSIKAS